MYKVFYSWFPFSLLYNHKKMCVGILKNIFLTETSEDIVVQQTHASYH